MVGVDACSRSPLKTKPRSNVRGPKPAVRKVEWLFLLLGVGLLAALLDRVGWSEILHQFRQVGWFFLLVLLVSGGRYLFRTVAWRRAFPGREKLPSFLVMFQVRLAGDALNYLSFAGPLLGEPAKATLLRERLPLAVGLGGTLLEAGSFAVASGLVILVGLILALLRVTLDEQLMQAGWWVAALLALTLLCVWGAIRRQVRIASTLLGWLSRTPLARWVDPRRPRIEELEGKLHQFYVQHTRNFRLMFLWDCVAQVFAMAEIYIILGRLGLWVTLADLFILEAMGKVISTMFFFVPARVGTDEGGMGAVFALMGFGLARGVGLALVQRLRALTWSALGVVFLGRYALRRST